MKHRTNFCVFDVCSLHRQCQGIACSARQKLRAHLPNAADLVRLWQALLHLGDERDMLPAAVLATHRLNSSVKMVGRNCSYELSGKLSTTALRMSKPSWSCALLAISFWNTPSSGSRWPPLITSSPAFDRYAWSEGDGQEESGICKVSMCLVSTCKWDNKRAKQQYSNQTATA